MRSVPDRIRHAVSFELIGVLIVSPLVSWAFDAGLHHVGVLAVAMSLLATVWNYVYNLLFDHALLRLRGRVRKTVAERVFHAVVFELGMLIFSLPPVMWWMSYSPLQALSMSASLMIFYLLYTYVFNWAYDVIFPIPGSQTCP